MIDLILSAELLECYVLCNGLDRFALFDNETGLQCSPFYTLTEWSGLNEAEVVLTYTANNPL